MALGAGSGHAVLLTDGLDDAVRLAIGGKGRAVADMVALGLRVPPAFCVTCDWRDSFSGRLGEAMWQDVLGGLRLLEERTGRTFGAGPRPLLLSVRSSGATSMPGMLETVLNVGVDDVVVAALRHQFDGSFADDVRERFRRGYRRAVGTDAPDRPLAQLRGAIEAVASSWSSNRVAAYREHRGIDRGGISIVLQAMVFGNMVSGDHDARSGTGVLFTRDPSSGASSPFGEWLPAAQGDDVVSGTRDCEPLSTLRDRLPAVYDELIDAGKRLERHGADVQDVEFTVESGTLWLLQSRVAKRSPIAALRLALAFRDEGVIDDADVLARVTPEHLAAILAVRSAPAGPPLATGAAACPGIASGAVYTTSDDAIAAADEGRDVILVRPTTSPDDVAGMMAASGIVTEVGGASSHAAIVARELGIPAVVGCGAGLTASLAGLVVTVDGDAGEVRAGESAAAAEPAESPELTRFAAIVDALAPDAVGDLPARHLAARAGRS